MNSENGSGGAADGPDAQNAALKGEQEGAQFSVVAQYIKDLSFESPNAPNSLRGPGENPNLQISVNVKAQKMQDDTYEVELFFEAHGKNDKGVIYNLELVYGGLFALVNLPEEALQPILFIDCPGLLFPYLRRVVGDLTKEGGFPPLNLDPINFAALYQENLKKQQEGGEAVAS